DPEPIRNPTRFKINNTLWIRRLLLQTDHTGPRRPPAPPSFFVSISLLPEAVHLKESTRRSMGNDQSTPRNEAALLLQLSNYDDTIRRLRNRLSAVEDEEQWMNKRVESDRVKSIKAAEELKDCMAECQKMESKHDRLVRRKATYDVEAARLATDIKLLEIMR
ncbi:unnamed protein product, partial [Musa banksii]